MKPTFREGRPGKHAISKLTILKCNFTKRTSSKSHVDEPPVLKYPCLFPVGGLWLNDRMIERVGVLEMSFQRRVIDYDLRVIFVI